MPKNEYDPYLNTAKRSLQTQQDKKRKKDFISNHQKSKSFFQKDIDLNNYINLSHRFGQLLVISLIITIPYTIGTLFFLLISLTNYKNYQNLEVNSYLLKWTIGYEIIASILLLMIFKSAIYFKNNDETQIKT
ncbi:MAG: hypothetical protein KU29_01470 [Sulfurovum sp. FS06-10]|nr:MAG: hypothetical protein KU29_01470 [Sulfurovum sp. FS06-10]